MSDISLQYKSHAMIDSLRLGECTIHRAGNSNGSKWWNLWMCVARDSDKQEDYFCVPVNPNYDLVPNGPGGRHWGLKKTGAGIWTVTPSVNVLSNNHVYPGPHPNRITSLWHHTPDIVFVPDGESWQS